MDRYEQRRADRLATPPRFYVRPLRVLAGVLLLAAAPLVGWIPGPGGIFVALPGAYLLASEVQWFARVLDRGEAEAMPRLQTAWSRLRRRTVAR